jgi:hypothetical protein
MENLCFLIGIACQFIRADKRIPDWAVLAISLVLSLGAYWLATPEASWADRGFYLAALDWWKTSLAGIVLTSMGAKGATALGLPAENPLNPLTDSK